MELTPIGEIAQSCWQEIPQHFPYVRLDEFVIMPNHVHGIIIIDQSKYTIKDNLLHGDGVYTLHATYIRQLPIANQQMSSISPKFGSLGSIVRSYKSAVTRNVHLNHFNMSWQPRFYDIIIRSKRSHQRISKYILRNPVNWGYDKLKYQ